jgi:hypothetical protein
MLEGAADELGFVMFASGLAVGKDSRPRLCLHVMSTERARERKMRGNEDGKKALGENLFHIVCTVERRRSQRGNFMGRD